MDLCIRNTGACLNQARPIKEQPMHLKNEILMRSLRRLLRLTAACSRRAGRLQAFVSGFMLARVRPEDRTRLTAEVYSSRGDYTVQGMAEWEQQWFQEDLPRPPARILLGGAGSGREMLHLSGMGHEVIAFDPAPSYVKAARGRLDGKVCRDFLLGSYEDLSDPQSEDARTFAKEVAEWAPFDAVVLGWGSIIHISTEAGRKSLLETLHTLCPRGPVLISFLVRKEGSAEEQATRLGFRAALLLRPRPTGPPRLDPGDRIDGVIGYSHYFSFQEFALLAAGAAYRVTRARFSHRPGTFPHATLRPD
jgi:hypothetical protein